MNYQKALALLIFIISFCGLLQYHRNQNLNILVKGPRANSELTTGYTEAVEQGYYVRHCTTNTILGKTSIALQTIPFEVLEATSPEIAEKRKLSFEEIFKNKIWIPKKEQADESRASGPGSTLHYAQDVIAALHSIISQLKRELRVDHIRLLDIPCGDMVWMSRFLSTRDDVHYTGFDIVPDLISRHQKTYVGQSNWRFRVQDIVRDGLNESYDLILCRMMLQHLFSQDALTVVKHFSESGGRYLLTTSFNRAKVNSELQGVASVRFRELNLELPPFSLTPPNCVVRDGEKNDVHGRNHFLGLWQLPVRRVKLCNSSIPFRVRELEVDFFSCANWL